MKKIPQRMCIGCNEKKDKTELIRIVRDTNGEISVDKTGKKPGRGAYICDNSNCLERLIKSKRLSKVLEVEISDDVYEYLRGVIVDRK